MIILKILLIIGIVLAALFVLSLIVYFFNLDMKAAAAVIPVFSKHYDRVDRKKKSKIDGRKKGRADGERNG